MNTRKYPAREIVTTSTVCKCKKCGCETGVYEAHYQEGDNHFHLDCVSDGGEKQATETKVHELLVEDDLSVKSEGR